MRQIFDDFKQFNLFRKKNQKVFELKKSCILAKI